MQEIKLGLLDKLLQMCVLIKIEWKYEAKRTKRSSVSLSKRRDWPWERCNEVVYCEVYVDSLFVVSRLWRAELGLFK